MIDTNNFYADLKNGKEAVAFRVFVTEKEIIFDVVAAKAKANDAIHFYKNDYGDKNQYADLSVKITACEFADYLTELRVNFKYETELTSSAMLAYGKSLASIERKLMRIAEKEGFHADPGEYIMRLCRVLKVKGFFYNSPDSMRRDIYIDGTSNIRSIIEKFKFKQDQKRKLNAA